MCALVAAATAACIAPPSVSEPASPQPRPDLPIVAVEVIDGDSLDTDDGEIRLDGLNAPEADECHGRQAGDALAALAAGEVAIEATGIDQFGRTLARVWSDGSSVNERLVADGHAIATSGDDDWTRRMIELETAARQAGRGLWASDACGEAPVPDLRIEFTEPDPPGPDDPDEEAVTIHNDGREDADISRFVLRDESSVNRLRFPHGTVILPGAALRVSTGCAPIDGIAWCARGPVWNNDGDSALLLSPSGTVVAHARYARSG